MPVFRVVRPAIHWEVCIVHNAASEDDAREKAFENDVDVSVISSEFAEVYDSLPEERSCDWVAGDKCSISKLLGYIDEDIDVFDCDYRGEDL